MKMDLSLIRRSLVSDGLAGQSAKVSGNRANCKPHHPDGAKDRDRAPARDPGRTRCGAAIEWLGKDFRNRTGINCKVAVKGVEKISDAVLSTAIFRIVQEPDECHAPCRGVEVKVGLEKKDGS